MKAIIILLSCVAVLFGDVMELKHGERIEGKFLKASANGAVIEVGGQQVTIPIDKLKAIYFGSAPPDVLPSTLLGALEALRALRSVTTSGVTYRDYTPRVLDTKIKVDQYLASPARSDESARVSIGRAMHYFELAARTWSMNLLPGHTDFRTAEELVREIRGDSSLTECPAINML